MATRQRGNSPGFDKGFDPSYDPFKGSKDSEYDIGKFYTRATNQHDHSSNVQLPLPKELKGHLQTIVNQGMFPYTSVQAIIRDAIVHRLEWLSGQNPADLETPQVVAFERMLARQEMRAEAQRAQEEIYAGFIKGCEKALDIHAWEQVLVLCDEMEMDLDHMDDAWRNRTLETIEKMRGTAGDVKARWGDRG